MPKTLQYRSGSVIYFQGDMADKIFVLKVGQINLVYQDIETGEDTHDFVQPGEFFGVKSTLGHYPREENAIALQDSTIMAFTVPEFESLALSNTRIIMKMLKIFSKQLRRIHQQVSSVMEKKEQPDPELGLFNIGEYYLRNKQYSQARYVFNRYLTHYPLGRKANQAEKNLELAESQARAAAVGKASASHRTPPEIVRVKPPVEAPKNISATAAAYNEAMDRILKRKYQQAYIAFNNIVQADAEPEYTIKSSYELGRCLFLLAKYRDCIQYYTTMITRYPKHPKLAETLFFMGQSYEKIGKKEQAAIFFKKARSLSGEKEDESQEKTANKALGA
ncbi:cyclic nucleotide-binding domain-containing protein [Treponema sp. TIM-1]|uniref:cyclic nucleotide-binding domain-containing protein n=1 Tax=Treponema sp. TIM-1 TaxID=2898417 RepID=UPI0039810B71